MVEGRVALPRKVPVDAATYLRELKLSFFVISFPRASSFKSRFGVAVAMGVLLDREELTAAIDLRFSSGFGGFTTDNKPTARDRETAGDK